jgi:hypothetical protein
VPNLDAAWGWGPHECIRCLRIKCSMIAVSRQTQFTTGRMNASTSTSLILWRTCDAVIVHCGVPKYPIFHMLLSPICISPNTINILIFYIKNSMAILGRLHLEAFIGVNYSGEFKVSGQYISRHRKGPPSQTIAENTHEPDNLTHSQVLCTARQCLSNVLIPR